MAAVCGQRKLPLASNSSEAMSVSTKSDQELLAALWGNCTYETWCAAYPLFQKVRKEGLSLSMKERQWIVDNLLEKEEELDPNHYCGNPDCPGDWCK